MGKVSVPVHALGLLTHANNWTFLHNDQRMLESLEATVSTRLVSSTCKEKTVGWELGIWNILLHFRPCNSIHLCAVLRWREQCAEHV